MIKVVRVKKQTVSIQFSPLPSYHLGHGLGGCTVGTTMGIPAQTMETVVPQTSSLNLVEMPTVVYGCLLHLPLRGFSFSPTQMEGTEDTVEAKYPGARRCRLWLTNTKTIGSLQWQTAGEPHAPYRIKVPLAPGQGRGNRVGIITPGTVGCRLRPKIPDTMGFPQQHTDGAHTPRIKRWPYL
jgi:hypothetical protein